MTEAAANALSISQADLVVADLSEDDSTIFFELGQAQSMGKGIIGIADSQDAIRTNSSLFSSIPIIRYDRFDLDRFVKSLQRAATNFRRSPTHINSTNPSLFPIPFYMDWDKLSDRDTENLCQELLAQMGYRRINWSKLPHEIDLIAQLPRKDPDGFEFNELWLVSFGRHRPIEAFLEIAISDPDYFMHQIFRYSDSPERNLSAYQNSLITVLLISTDRLRDDRELLLLQERFELRGPRKRDARASIRVRIWDRSYLTSIVQRFPQIAYKYFSDESRLRSETRKSFQDLYNENSVLLAQQRRLNMDLKSERDLRLRAERDSVWKEISFSAAHKIGNPIFAIETGLAPLRKRISEGKTDDALGVVDKIGRSVEKAKSFVDQFKSLARAQKIEIVPCRLRPILQDCVKTLSDHNVKYQIVCDDKVEVLGDPERLAECFDELVTNALRWMKRREKKIEIVAHILNAKERPDFLDTKSHYVRVNFRDNGQGIPTANKSKIFEAFFTDYEHGTGLGLALVRRIIEGHGGGVIETGKPGAGADFELYLPLVPAKQG